MSRSVRWVSGAAALLVAASTQAQAAAAPAPPPQPAPAPAAPPPAAGQGTPATAGSQGQSSAAQPGSPGASSQQVVVNPPQPVPPAAPPSSTTVVNPPATAYGPDVTVVERREHPNPMATVATDTLYGGVAGLLVGVGVGLVNQWDTWHRDVMVGAGVGLLVGAAVGVVHAAYDERAWDRRVRRVASTATPPAALARDGLDRTDRDPVISGTTFGLAVGF